MRWYLLLVCIAMMPGVAVADSATLDAAISDARVYCLGLSDSINNLKTMAGINTAVTGVGSAVGVGATAVGIAKSSKDKEVEELEKHVAELRALGAKQDTIDYIPVDSYEDFLAQLHAGGSDYDNMPDDGVASGTSQQASDPKLAQAEEKLRQETAKSKNLGNWRTGLLAANTATNIAGTIIASQNKVDDELQEDINVCVAMVNNLREITMREHVAGNIDQARFSYAMGIVNACGAWETTDLSKINAKAKGAAISSGIGIGVGLAGTITSAVANTDKTRNDNTETGKQKEKNLNTASNILAGGATAASTVATIFNATQIGVIKRALSTAAACEEAL